jgi:16S rRNA (uracil1498-N3)-methyltransferase
LRISRIHTDLALEPESELVLQGGAAHYLLRVLRVTPDQSVILFNGDGHDYVSEVVMPGKKDVRLRVLSRSPARPESPLRVTLVQALSRGERMDQTLQKSTELGVVAFQPLLTERVEVRIRSEKLKQRMEHWHKVVVSACEQCGRATIPDLNEPIGLDEWLGRTEKAQRLVLEPGSETALAKTRLGDRVELLIGPEGGFSERELAMMSQNEVLAVSLGPRILRTETAGPAAIAVLQAIAGDLR